MPGLGDLFYSLSTGDMAENEAYGKAALQGAQTNYARSGTEERLAKASLDRQTAAARSRYRDLLSSLQRNGRAQYAPEQADLISSLMIGQGGDFRSVVQGLGDFDENEWRRQGLEANVAGDRALGLQFMEAAKGEPFKRTEVSGGVSFDPYMEDAALSPTPIGLGDIALKAAQAGSERAQAEKFRAEAGKANRDTGGGRDAPSGFQWTPDGSRLAPIPGGPQDPETKGREPRVVPQKAIDDLADQSATAEGLERLVTTFKKDFGGNILGDIENTIRRIATSDETGQAQWWQDYQLQANKIRNSLFGSALTAPELAAFDAAMITPRMDPTQIATNLTRQKQLADAALKKIVAAGVANYRNPEAISAATGGRGFGDTPEATKTVNGVTYVKLNGKWFSQ